MNTEDRIKKIIVDTLGVDESEVAPEASFTNDLGADSLDSIELIMEFEKEFNMSIPDDDAEELYSVGKAVAYIDERLNQAQHTPAEASLPEGDDDE
jgi:acyl carrier protein